MTEDVDPILEPQRGDGRSPEFTSSPKRADLVEQAQSSYETGDYSSAQELMETAAKMEGADDEFFHNLGLIYMAREDYLAAISAFDRSVPSIPDGLVNRGYCWELVGDIERARSDYLSALQVDSRDVDALVNLGTLELAEGRIEKAKILLSQAVEIDPRCNWQLADVFLEMSDLQAAKHALEVAEASGEERAADQLAEVREMIRRQSIPGPLQ